MKYNLLLKGFEAIKRKSWKGKFLLTCPLNDICESIWGVSTQISSSWFSITGFIGKLLGVKFNAFWILLTFTLALSSSISSFLHEYLSFGSLWKLRLCDTPWIFKCFFFMEFFFFFAKALNLFLTIISVLPGKNLEILDHWFGCFEWYSKRVKSSLGFHGSLLILGSRIFIHLSLHCFPVLLCVIPLFKLKAWEMSFQCPEP